MDVSLILALLALGAAVGFAAGLLGIGGGLLLVPFLTLLLTIKGLPGERVVQDGRLRHSGRSGVNSQGW